MGAIPTEKPAGAQRGPLQDQAEGVGDDDDDQEDDDARSRVRYGNPVIATLKELTLKRTDRERVPVLVTNKRKVGSGWPNKISSSMVKS